MDQGRCILEAQGGSAGGEEGGGRAVRTRLVRTDPRSFANARGGDFLVESQAKRVGVRSRMRAVRTTPGRPSWRAMGKARTLQVRTWPGTPGSKKRPRRVRSM